MVEQFSLMTKNADMNEEIESLLHITKHLNDDEKIKTILNPK